MEVRTTSVNNSFGTTTTTSSSASPQSSGSSRSAASRDLNKFLTASQPPKWEKTEFDDDDFLTATWHGDTLVGKDGGSVAGSVELAERTKKGVPPPTTTKSKKHETSTLIKKPQQQSRRASVTMTTTTEPIPENKNINNPDAGPEPDHLKHRGRNSRSPVPGRRSSMSRAKSERLSKPTNATSLDMHLLNEKRMVQPSSDLGRAQEPLPKTLSPNSAQGSSTITDLTDEDNFTIISNSDSSASRRSGLQRAHSESLLKALRQRTKVTMHEIGEDKEYTGPLRSAPPNRQSRRSRSPSSASRSRSPRKVVRQPPGISPKKEMVYRIPNRTTAIQRAHSLSPNPEEEDFDESPRRPIPSSRNLSRAMSEKITLATKVKEEQQRLSLHGRASKRSLNRHPSMGHLAAERTDSLREVFDWNGSSSSSQHSDNDGTRSQSSCGRSQSSQSSKHSLQGRRMALADMSPTPPVTTLKRCASSDFPKERRTMNPIPTSFHARRGSMVELMETTTTTTSVETTGLSRRKSMGGPFIMTSSSADNNNNNNNNAGGRLTPKSASGNDKALSRRPSLRRMASNSSMDRRELFKRTNSNSSMEQYQITPTLRRTSSSVNRQAAHSLFYDTLRISQRDLLEEVNDHPVANNNISNNNNNNNNNTSDVVASKLSIRAPCSKEEAMTFHGILKDVSASKQFFNSMLSK